MPKAYWITCYRSISDPRKLAAYRLRCDSGKVARETAWWTPYFHDHSGPSIEAPLPSAIAIVDRAGKRSPRVAEDDRLLRH